MAPPADRGAAEAKNLRVLLPFSRDSLRIPDELAWEIGGGKALVVGGSGGKAKVWPVEVGRDGDGAFLGRGWPEFACACDAGEGWLLVLRHRCRGLLTVKAFDHNCCLTELGAPPAAEATINTDASRTLQFIRVLPPGSMEKMLMPSKFVEQYIPEEHLNKHVAVVFGRLGKVCPIELEMSWPDVFFTGVWSKFLAVHGITEANPLLLRYEGNMLFTVKVFGADGCQSESGHKDIRMQQCVEEQQEILHASAWNCKSKKDRLSCEEKNKQKISMNPLFKMSLRRESDFHIGPPSWIKKKIYANTDRLALATEFCYAIGLREDCTSTITLKTSMNSKEYWHVHGIPGKNKRYRLGQGWKKFCQENSIKLGDICTFNVVETTVWHVVVTCCKDRINQLYYETSPTSNRKCSSKNNRSSSKSKKRARGSRTLNKASETKHFFDIGPPAWIKEIKTCSTEGALYLPEVFCKAIGIREPSNVTLKTSMSSTRSWQARVVPYKHSSHHVTGLGWKSFCQDNGIKVGDICTINIVETTLWQVDIMCR